MAAWCVAAGGGIAAVEVRDAVDREFSLFAGDLLPLTVGDAVSREFSLFTGDLESLAVADAVSREFSLFVGDLGPIAVSGAVSREFSLMAGGAPLVPSRDAVSREFSVLVSTPPIVVLATTPLDYREGDPPLVIDAAALVENPDSDGFDGGSLRVEITPGPEVGDRLFVLETAGGDITLEGADEVLFQDTPIGTWSGGEGSEALVFALNANAGIAAVQALVRAIAFENGTRFPAAGVREVGFVLTDALVGDGPIAVRDILVEPVNEDPLAGDDVLGAEQDVPLVFDVARLLANDMDPDGDSPLLVAFPSATTTAGGSVEIDGEVVTYTPAPGFTGVDRFSYTLSDPFGGMDTAMVTVHVRAADDPSLTVLQMGLNEAGYAMSLVGLPGQIYQGYVSEDLEEWEPLVTAEANEVGHFQVLDADAGGFPARFYRFALASP